MKLEIDIPTSLSEIPLKSYQQFIKLQKDSNDEEFIAQKMVQIFCGLEFKDIAKMKLTSLNELIQHFVKLFSEKPKFQNRFKIKTQEGEIEFGFIPELEAITFGEYVDLESHLMSWDDYHKAMAVMYRPVMRTRKDKYEIMPYEANQDFEELMKFAPLDVVLASSVFFWTLGSELLEATLSYLEKEMKKNKNLTATFQKQLNLPNDGDGINQYMLSLRETLQDLTRLQDTDFLCVSPISPLKSKKTKSNKDS
tara:strand:- start:668 stop:1423 length:756 start_codon:yes stop_codon:yes gene_type:complete